MNTNIVTSNLQTVQDQIFVFALFGNEGVIQTYIEANRRKRYIHGCAQIKKPEN